MKQYQQTESGTFIIDGKEIPAVEGNRHYREMQAEVAAGTAEILPPQANPNAYLDARQEGYGSPREQLDMIADAGLQAWLDHRVAVDAAHPAA